MGPVLIVIIAMYMLDESKFNYNQVLLVLHVRTLVEPYHTLIVIHHDTEMTMNTCEGPCMNFAVDA